MNFDERNPLSISSLSAAVEQNDVSALRRLLRSGRNPNITDNRGWTPLHAAAAAGHLDCIEILLKRKARINVLTHQGETPFFIACKFNQVEVVKKLLNVDKNFVHTSDNECVTPLHMAVTKHNLHLAKLLLEEGAYINAEDNSGFTPLLEATMKKDIELVKMLLDHGADINVREYYGHLSFHFAAMSGSFELLSLLAGCHKEHGNLLEVINTATTGGQTPLSTAVQSEALDNVKELLKLGASTELLNRQSRLALHTAAHLKNIELLKIIRNATSTSVIEKHCTVPTNIGSNVLCNRIGATWEVSLVSLALDSGMYENLEYILDCGLSHDVLNCPVLLQAGLPIFYEEVRSFQPFGPHRTFEVDVDLEDFEIDFNAIQRNHVLVLHPVVFLLKDKFTEFGKDTKVYLNMMLQKGLTFNMSTFEQIEGIHVLHPYDAIFSNSEYFTTHEWKSHAICCLLLLFGNGMSVDYGIQNADDGIPVLFVHACRLPFLELIPYLLLHSVFVDIDDLLRWVVHKIFLRVFPNGYEDVRTLVYTYKYLIEYTSKSYINFLDEITKPGYESRFHEVVAFINTICTHELPSLQLMCRSVIRKAIKDSCKSCPHQLKIRINGLELPEHLIAFLNYNDMFKTCKKCNIIEL